VRLPYEGERLRVETMRERLTAGLHAFTRRTRTSGDLIRASDVTQRALLVTIALTALAFALRIYRLDAQSLWLDEGSTWVEVTGKGWLALVAELFSPNAGYPLYHLLLKAWVLIAGDAEWALRFPSALAGALVVPVLMAAVGELSSHHTHSRGMSGAPPRSVRSSRFRPMPSGTHRTRRSTVW
jgi:predicted membrane-bound mannosyltransferase